MPLKRRASTKKTTKSSKSNRLKAAAKTIKGEKKKKKLHSYTSKDIVPTGSTLLNLACSEYAHAGFSKGKLVNIIGDSSSGKTLLALTGLAEGIYSGKLKNYDFFLDDTENALEFELEKSFGRKAATRIKSPYSKDENGMPRASETVEDFYLTIHTMLKEVITGDRNPFIYVLDSLDAVTARENQALVEEAKKKDDPDALAKSYKTGKARMMSDLLSVIVGMLRRTECVLIIISQTRDNIGVGFAPKTRSGGKALKFYSTHEMWLAVKKKIKSKDREIGAEVIVKVSKNKLTGKKRVITFNVYDDYGVDDLGSMVDYLVAEKEIKKVKGTLSWKGVSGSRANFIKKIETSPSKIKIMRKACQRVWLEIEEDLKQDRKPRFS